MGAPFILQEESVKDVVNSVGVITDYLKKFEQKDMIPSKFYPQISKYFSLVLA